MTAAWIAPVGLVAGLVTGIYAVAVLEEWIGARVAGRPVGWGAGLVAPVRNAALRLVQRRTRTERPDAEAWALAPALLAGLAAVAVTPIPLAPGAAIADIESGIVLFGAAVAVVMIAVFLHGWSANSVFPLIGGYRFVAQALSYQIPLFLVLVAAALPAESLSVKEIVESQRALWNIVRQPLGLPIYLIAALGVAFYGPLNLPDAPDLAGGTSAESSGPALLLWRAARAAMLVGLAGMGAAVFLGGPLGPWAPGPVWLALKTLALLIVLIAAGQTIGRVRIESFVFFGWAVLIPAALVDVFVSGILIQ